MVADRVLAANIARHLGGNLIDLVDGLGEERQASGFLGEHLQRAARMAHFGAGHLGAEEQANRIDDGAGELLHAVDGLLQVKA